MKNNISKIIFTLVLITSTAVVMAQPGGPGGGVPGPPPPAGPGAGAPIDGGASALLLGVAGYAYKHLKNKKATTVQAELPL